MRKLHALTLLTVMVLTAASAACAFAADTAGKNGKTIPPATVNIPVTHNWEGGSCAGDDTVTYILTAEEDKCPMPEGSAGGVKTVTAGAQGSVDLGDIIFEYPDAYFYDITRTFTDTKKITHDTGSYRVLVVKFNTGDTLMVIWDRATGEKAEQIVFTDVYSAPDASRADGPGTGDHTAPGLTASAALFVTAASCLAVFAVKTKRRRKGERAYEEQ